jgi:hypothetical protein
MQMAKEMMMNRTAKLALVAFSLLISINIGQTLGNCDPKNGYCSGQAKCPWDTCTNIPALPPAWNTSVLVVSNEGYPACEDIYQYGAYCYVCDGSGQPIKYQCPVEVYLGFWCVWDFYLGDGTVGMDSCLLT